MRSTAVYFCIAVLLMLTACAGSPEVRPAPPAVREDPTLRDNDLPYIVNRGNRTPTESELNSLKVFNQIYKLTRSSRDRNAALPEVERLYLKIIREYPDAPLAQESYWRLMTLYMRDYSPPAFERAESLYNKYLQGNEKPVLRGLLEEILGKGYYRREKWEDLVRISENEMNQYKEQGTKPRPSLVFLNAEAYYHLGNLDEAEKGYRILLDLYPQLIEGKTAEKRLKAMENKS